MLLVYSIFSVIILCYLYVYYVLGLYANLFWGLLYDVVYSLQ